MTISLRICPLLFFVSLLFAQNTDAQNKPLKYRTLIVVFDGLRPEYITPEIMPNVYAFSKQGVYARQHHSVFPTVTRVNGASYASGSYPATHGILGNSVYFPEINPLHGLNTGDYRDLVKINAATGGHLLTATSLGEALRTAGTSMMVFSSGSSGQAFMQNHTVNGGIVHPELILPDALKERVLTEAGEVPESADPNTNQHRWITDALIKIGFATDGPAVNAIWFSDPDGTAHRDGIGAPEAMRSISIVDQEFGRIIRAIKDQNLTKSMNVIITADHGFVTYAGETDLVDFLVKKKLKHDKESDDVVVVAGAIYIKDHDPNVAQQIVSALQAEPWVGGIFTAGERAGSMKGIIPGTLSFESIHWNHPSRTADILVDKNWNDTKNKYGYAGTSFSVGVAGHSGLSPYEVHIALLADGPAFRKHYESNVPTSNIDIVPTILSISGIAIPPSMEGRIMSELLNSGAKSKTPVVKIETITTSSDYDGGTYTLELHRSLVGNKSYIDFSKTTRKP